MGIKSETIKLGDKELKVKQISFAGQLRLNALGEKLSTLEQLKECVEPVEILEQLTVDEGLELLKKVSEINGWDKAKDFQGTPSG